MLSILILKDIASAAGNYLGLLLPVASMLLALPAGESVDEFVFSSSGRTHTKDRNRMSPARLEQITVLVMFIRNFGWSLDKFHAWVVKALQETKGELNQ